MRIPLSLFVSTLTIISIFSSMAHAQTTLIENENLSLSVGGYASSYLLFTKLDYDLHGIKKTQASSSHLFRMETRGTVGETLSFDIHNRFFLRLSNSDTSTLGLGATKRPERLVNMRTGFNENDGLIIEHDLDRLSLTWPTPLADFTIGRQAITWGNSAFFGAGDLWTQFSPFEADTSQKRGVDSLRAIAYPSDTISLDFVLVDRGSLENLSGGIKVETTLWEAEYYAGISKNFRNANLQLGSEKDFDKIRVHWDIAFPLDLDKTEFHNPILSAGGDYLGSKSLFSVEYFFNSYGAEKEDYLQTFIAANKPQGQSYLLGKHYLGTLAGYLPIPELTLNLFTIINLLDGSAILSPTLSYQATDNATLKIGGFLGVGERPEMEGFFPRIPSEFGLGGYSAFVQLSTYL